MDNPPPGANLIVRELRRRFTGVLFIEAPDGALHEPVRYIIDGREGAIIVAPARSLEDAESIVLFAPEERDDAAQVLITPEEIADWRGSEACDRWSAHHGRAPGARWYTCAVAGCRLGSEVCDADEVDLRNPLIAAEPRLCRFAMADRARLGALAARVEGRPVPDAVCVGVDHLGLSLRGPLGVLRIEFDSPARAEPEAQAAISRLLSGADPRADA